MSKTKMDRKVNRAARSLNRQLEQDVFGKRFWARQRTKIKVDGIEHYQYELIDHLEPERNQILPWETGFALTNFHTLSIAMNKFIVESDFWELFKQNELCI